MIGIDSGTYKLTKVKGRDVIVSKDYNRRIICKDIVYIKDNKACSVMTLAKPIKVSKADMNYFDIPANFRDRSKVLYTYSIKSHYDFNIPVSISSKNDRGIYSNIQSFNNISSRNIEFIKPIKPYKDQESCRSNEFFAADDMKKLEYDQLICERKIDGIRVQLHKDINRSEAFTFFGNRIPNNKIQHILNDLRQYSEDILILDGELYSDKGEDVFTLISDKDITAPIASLKIKAFDILNIDGEYLTAKPLSERKELLANLHTKDSSITLSRFADVKDFDNFTKNILPSIEKLPNVEGLVLKDKRSTYTPEDCHKWYKMIFPTYLVAPDYSNSKLQTYSQAYLESLHYNLHRFYRKKSEGKTIAGWPFSKIEDEHKSVIRQLAKHKPKIRSYDTLDATYVTKEEYVKLKAITGTLLEGYDDSQLVGTHYKLHVSFGTFLRHGIYKGQDVADLVNAHWRVIREFDNRGFKHRFQDSLDDVTLKYKGNMKATDSLAGTVEKIADQEIEFINNYDPNLKQPDELKRDWTKVSKLYEIYLTGKSKFTIEDIVNAGVLIMKELNTKNVKFKPDAMTPVQKRFYEKIKSIVDKKTKIVNFSFLRINPSGKVDGDRIYLKDVKDYFNADFKISEPFIYLVGGLANHPDEGTTGDIDILIKKQEPINSNDDRALQFRILRALPEQYRKRVHFVYDDLHGPFTNYVSLWNLELRRNKDSATLQEMKLNNEGHPKWYLRDNEGKLSTFTNVTYLESPDGKRINIDSNLREDIMPVLLENNVEYLVASNLTSFTMGALADNGIQFELKRDHDYSDIEYKFTLGKFFMMPKPTHGRTINEIYTPLSVLTVIKSKSEWLTELKEKGLYIETKYDGIRCQVHKIGDTVRIWTEEGNLITEKLPTIVKDFLKMDGDFEAEFELELWLNGAHMPRSVPAGMVHKTELDPNEDKLKAVIYDSLYFNGINYVNEPYSVRLEAIMKFNIGSVTHTVSKLAKTENDVITEIESAAKRKGSEGAMIKMPSYMYDFDGTTNQILKYKNEISIYALVLEKNSVKGSDKTFNYLCGVGTVDEPAYIGKTFNTNVEAEAGEVIEVVTVEVTQYNDDDKIWFNWWSPRVLKKREMNPTSIEKTKQIVMDTTGIKANKKLPDRAREKLQEVKTKK